MDENLAAFLRVLNSQDMTTGGGTASAIAGAMAGGLISMVARLSIGKPGMGSEEFYLDIAREAEALSENLFEGGRKDSLAFESVRAAYRLDKSSISEKEIRSKAIQSAWIQAANQPMINAEACARLLTLASSLQDHSNPNAASDLECALYLARAGVSGCVANVEINLPNIKDAKVAAEFEKRASQLKTLAAARNYS